MSMNIERILQVLSFMIALSVVAVSGAFFYMQSGMMLQAPAVVPVVVELATGTPKIVDRSFVGLTTSAVVPAKMVIPEPKKSIPTVVAPTSSPQKTIEAPGPLYIKKTTQPDSTPTPIITPTSGTSTATTISDSGTPSTEGALSQIDIVRFTNGERVTGGLPPLSFNNRLTAIAEAKAVDMIAKQYFAHVSPSGVDVANLAEIYGYSYLNIGENLALGDFVSSREVVTGWMNSPGHRANIMNVNYREIGVAAILGIYEGRQAWFAVQEFGRPLADCPLPDALLKQKIVIYQEELSQLGQTLAKLKVELDAPGISASVHNQYVDEFNTIVVLHNSLIETTKSAIAKYNVEADIYNTCVDI